MVRVEHIKPSDIKIAQDFKREAAKLLGDNLVMVKMYGSRAYGSAKADSDMDILLLTQHEVPHASPESRQISDLAAKYLLDYDILISPVIYPFNQYEKYKSYSPVLYWIQEEGVDL